MMLRRLFLALSTGLLLALAWPDKGFPFLALIGFVPLLILHNELALSHQKRQGWRIFGWSYLAFLVWNLITTWWIYYASPIGMVLAVLCNTAMMATLMVLYHKAHRLLDLKRAALSLLVMWAGWEWLTLNWDLAWPWLNLGNAFAHYPNWVQWYEYTGAAGGSLWLMASNLVLFSAWKRMPRVKTISGRIAVIMALLLLLIGVPGFISLLVKEKTQAAETIEVVVVQPNIDPYEEKFSREEMEMVEEMIAAAELWMTDSTSFVIFPETALPSGIIESRLYESSALVRLTEWIADYPNAKLITGASTYNVYENEAQRTTTARRSSSGFWYDAYNTGLLITATGVDEIYHKSKLVVGVEQMPFYEVIAPLMGEWIIDLGGISGTLSVQDDREVFCNGPACAAPVICYESVFPGFVTEYMREGANFIAIFTNDGWWRNTPGYRQHFQFARLRAIENRVAIARSANTGISGFILPDGSITQTLGWDVRGALRESIPVAQKQTFFSRQGDYLGRLMAFLSILFIFYLVVAGVLRKSAHAKAKISE